MLYRTRDDQRRSNERRYRNARRAMKRRFLDMPLPEDEDDEEPQVIGPGNAEVLNC